jgi:biopolymer transport protein TolR
MQAAGAGPSKRRGRFLRSSGQGAGAQDFDLNLAPVIDCLTVLITFVLISASYVSVGVLQAEVAAASTTSQDQKKPDDEMLTVELKDDHSILVRLTGKKNQVSKINPNSDRSWNYGALTTSLAMAKNEVPNLSSLVLNADSDVDYREVIKTMELARKTAPSVLLGGY